MITGEIGCEDIGSPFSDLGGPERHCKILVLPDVKKEDTPTD
jgi:hypothetical protein